MKHQAVGNQGLSPSTNPEARDLAGQAAAVLVYSNYPNDPRPRRAAEALVGLGMKVQVICLRQNKREPTRDTCNGVEILRFPMSHWRGGKFAYCFQYGVFILGCLLLLGLRSLSRRYRLVHVHNMPDILVFASLFPKILGAKVILDLHDPMPELMTTICGMHPDSVGVRFLKCCERISVRFADIVLTPNLSFQKLFESRGCSPSKLHVVMNAPDEGIFKFRPIHELGVSGSDKRPFVVMYHGALVERHGLDLAVSAVEMARASVPNIELRIYGHETPFVRQVMEQVKQRGSGNFVKYFGGKTLEKIVEAIDQCDVGIIPNRRSVFTEINLPTRIFEYLARGKPVIAPRTQGIQDYFSQDDLFLFELGDAADLARTITSIFLHSEDTLQRVKRGQAIYCRHRWERQRLTFVGVVLSMLTGVAFEEPCETLDSLKLVSS